ncbi:aldo/keto reductase, partial [Mycobacterium sp. 1423905.2]|uniref:aldo/keto reductase n=1 Tax=Mycobacterium sp. 1423905.2 TaxID=1856859 RepID=UPI000A55250F
VDQLLGATRGQVVHVLHRDDLGDLLCRGELVDAATEQGIGFIPWFPLAAGPLAAPDGPLHEIAENHDASPSQLALAWLLKRSPVILPIPGTSSVQHLEENVAAAEITLSDEEFDTIAAAAEK